MFQAKGKTLFPCENISRLGENEFKESKRSSQRRKRVYRGKARLASEMVAIKGEKAATE